jgi:hypothetical protein
MSGRLQISMICHIVILLFVPDISAQDWEDSSLEINIGTTNPRVASVIERVNRQTGYRFTYDTRAVDPEQKVYYSTEVVELETLLDTLAGNLGLGYEIIDKYIVLYRQSQSTSRLTVAGRVIDADTHEPMVYAYVAIKGKNIGTVTNSDGDFVLNVPVEFMADSLTVSHMGYKNSSMAVALAAVEGTTIRMVRDYITIQEVIINVRDPLSILNSAVRSIPDNYGDSPALLTGFYREGITRKNEFQIYSEAVVQIYKASYSRQIASDQVRVLRSRKMENLEAKDTLAVRLAAGLETVLSLDGARNLFDFIDPANFNLYEYRFTDMVIVDDESAFVISFEQKNWVEEPMFRGEVYVNSVDNAILMASFEINPDQIGQVSDVYVSKVPGSYSVETEYVRYSVRYKNRGDRYFLSHVRGDLGFTARSKRKLFSSRYNVFLEFAVTNSETDSVEKFDRSEQFPLGSVFTTIISGYDADFWEGFDFIKPDESLEKSMKKLEIELSEFYPED